MNTFQLNKLSKLHDGERVFFCKTDVLENEFEIIKNLEHEVILISGNSDIPIGQRFSDLLPSNVKFWFAQNCIVKNPKIIPLPLGIENKESCEREGHGVGYDRVKIKESIISSHPSKKPSKLIYSNFRIMTNVKHRLEIRNKCVDTSFIDWDEPNLSVEDFFLKILDYDFVVCPDGNGPDTYRFYEVLYMNRIPITFNKTMYDLLHNKFPCIFIEDIELLSNINYIRGKFENIQNSRYNTNILDCNWWIENIIHKKTLLN